MSSRSMKFKVSSEKLNFWFKAISKTFVFASNLGESFRSVRFTVSHNGLFLEAMDSHSYTRVGPLPVFDFKGEAGEFYVRYEIISRIASSTDFEVFKFNITDSRVNIATEARYSLSHIIIEEGYAAPKLVENSKLHVVEDADFVEVMEGLLPFVSDDFSRPDLAGITIAESLYVSSESTHGVIHGRVENALPVLTAMPYFVKYLSAVGGIEKLGMYADDSRLVFKGKNFYFESRLQVTKFPFNQLRKLMDARDSARLVATVSTNEFFDALGRVSLLAVDKYNQVTFKFSKSRIQLSCRSVVSGGVAKESVPVADAEYAKGWQDASLFYLGMSPVESLRKLFGGADDLMSFVVVEPKVPIFVECENSEYVFYSQVQLEVLDGG